MDATEAQRRGTRFLMVSAALVVVVAGLRAIKSIALPFVLAIFLSVLSAPILSWQLRHRVPKFFAILTTLLANLAVVVMVLLLVGGSIRAFSASLPTYQQQLESRARTALDWLESKGVETQRLSWLQGRSDADAAGSEANGDGDATEGGEAAPRRRASLPPDPIDLGPILDVIGSTLRSIAELTAMAFLIFLMMVFILSEASGFPRKLQLALGWDRAELERMSQARREIQRYLGIKTLVSLLTGVLLGLWVGLLGVEFPQLWGLMAFLLNYIPNLGSFIAAAPAVLLALLEMGLGQALLVALGYAAVNVVLGNLIEPHLMGRQFGISTLAVVLSLLFWGWVWGPIGMLLSVPLTMVLKILLEHTEDFRWVAHLIGANPPSDGEAALRSSPE
jgi:predicted PurR-regulated permease PerM